MQLTIGITDRAEVSMSFTKNLQEYVLNVGFNEVSNLNYEKKYKTGYSLKLSINDALNKANLIYPNEIRNILSNMNNTVYDEHHKENLVVFRCIDQLLDKGYFPYDLELEKRWSLGHTSKSGRADIVVYKRSKSIEQLNDQVLCIIECKTYGKEFKTAKKETESDGGQLFSYFQQDRSCEWLILYSNNLSNQENIEIKTIKTLDDNNILELHKRDSKILTYENAKSKEDLFTTWVETYNKDYVTDVLFSSPAYQLGIFPLTKGDLKEIPQDNNIINQFEEILRHNNISDKENAFNRLIALFICKVVDESYKGPNDILDFQYKVSVDTYETLQDRLQRLHKDGMEKFMKEDIFYLPDTYADDLFKQYKNKRNNLIKDLKEKIKFLKFYSNNDFAFKDVHNEELFYQNGKVVVEMVQLFENYKIIGTENLQLLGDLFEQLLNKGFKQSEGQFFTPYPITRFIFKALPLDIYIRELPKTIDYACGAGHFLAEAYDSIKELYAVYDKVLPVDWERDYLFGIEKDYRLARVSKISMFMHGANKANIVFGDGLDNYSSQNIKKETFDLLVANPPYSVSGFKDHLKLSENKLVSTDFISIDGSEIETCFVERISQLLKPKGVCAVILPSTLLNKDYGSYIYARKCILENFYIRAIAQFNKGTFGATDTATVILFLSKFNEPPKRVSQVLDSVDNIMSNCNELSGLEDDDIFKQYLEHIDVSVTDYQKWLAKEDYKNWKDHRYFGIYYKNFSNKKLSKSKKNNDTFYSIFNELEKDKIKYFGLVYKQKTVITEFPTETQEQKNFLGYEWSNRKGQEGIKIRSDFPSIRCGCLYNEGLSLSTIIKNAFLDKYDDLIDNCFISDTKDLINFVGDKFNKTIFTVRVQKIKQKEGYKIYSFSDEHLFSIFIGKRVTQNNISDNGIPVYSANVYEPFGSLDVSTEDKNVQKSSSKLIVWGIDGDWMVNIMPEDYAFYPTDHCGVLKVNTKELLAEYVQYSLYAVGKSQKFSRANRASIERIRPLKFQAPSLEDQSRIVSQISGIEVNIKKAIEKDHEIKNEIIKKYKYLASKATKFENLDKICNLERGTPLTRANAIEGNIPVVAGGIKPSCYHNEYNRQANVISVSCSGENAGYVNYWEEPIFATDCFTITCKTSPDANLFIYYSLLIKQDEIYKKQKGSSQPHVSPDDLCKFDIPILAKEELNDFINFASEKRREIAEQSSCISKLKQERDTAIAKYFDY